MVSDIVPVVLMVMVIEVEVEEKWVEREGRRGQYGKHAGVSPSVARIFFCFCFFLSLVCMDGFLAFLVFYVSSSRIWEWVEWVECVFFILNSWSSGIHIRMYGQRVVVVVI